MLDAAGKYGLNGGIFDGNLVAYGSFDECLSIQIDDGMTVEITTDSYNRTVKVPPFKGQYVLNKLMLILPDLSAQKRFHYGHGDYGTDFGIENNLTLDFFYVHFLDYLTGKLTFRGTNLEK